SSSYNILDLFRYSNANTLDLSPGGNPYFSIDNGTTNLGAFNDPTVNGGDTGDWASSVTNDSFDATSISGNPNPVTTLDLRTMNVLGYSLQCFAAGTRILTDRGEVPVESLAPGDRVITRFVGTTPIRWIGHRRIDCARHPDPALVRPIRIAPDAFGPGRPRRPLLLSPEHAVALDGALVPIRLLVNGASIAQLTGHDRVVYFHLELDRHDLLLAEGLEAESYLDTGNRTMFDNAGSPLLLHPDPSAGEAQANRLALSCLPFVADPALLEPRWRALAARSAALGLVPPRLPATTADADLHLRLGGRRIDPVWEGQDRALFAIQPNAGPARLVSRSVVPAALRPWVEDRRRLGVMVKGLTLRHGAAQAAVALDDPRLSGGWWAIERDAAAIWRWTDGAARLPVPQGGAVLEVRLGQPLAYPLPSARAA
ncbi:MAG: Hint domain-containing protein, partial [Rhodospirillales bacterium]|nr:Hint domain-containing protein [Rhodospirillales bacterium]